MKIIGYVRVSTNEQDLSVEAQRNALARWCETNGHTLAATYEDVGTSGSLPIEKRPGLGAALEALDEGDILLVLRRDRLARSVVTAATADALAQKAGASIRTVADGCDESETPEAALMKCILDAFAQYERALITLRIRSALDTKRAKGEVIGNIPFGYTREGDKLVEDATEQATITRAKQLAADGLSLRAIGAKLTEEGYKPRRGKVWHAESVKHLLQA